jgi:hypothetical protein
MTFPTQLSETPATGNPTRANEAFDTLNAFATYLKRHAACTGLTWGYWGDRWGQFSVAEGTLTLTDAADNYVVVLRSTGVISVSTSSTNWDDTVNYARVYKITTAGGVVTATEPHYSGPGGVHGSAAAAGSGTEMRGLTFTADTGSTADSDPGAGLFKWNNATQASATVLYIDEATADAVNVDASMGELEAGTLFIQQATDAARWQRWAYTATPVDGTGYWKLTVALLEKTSGDIQDGALCYFDFDDEGAPGVGGSTQGRQAIYIAAGSMAPSVSGGCEALTAIASAANQPDIRTLNFDQTTQEYAQFGIVMPKKWNRGTVTFVAHWSHAATTVNFGVVWDLQAVAVGNDDAIAAAYGTAQTSSDTGGTTNDLYTSPESAAITVAGSPAAEDMVFFRLSRVTGDGGDTMALDARLHGITLYVTTNADTDA